MPIGRVYRPHGGGVLHDQGDQCEIPDGYQRKILPKILREILRTVPATDPGQTAKTDTVIMHNGLPDQMPVTMQKGIPPCQIDTGGVTD